MVKYVPIFVIDEDDTVSAEQYSVNDLLTDINFHLNNVKGATLDNTFVKIHGIDYDDDGFYDSTVATLELRTRVDDKAKD